MEIGEGGRGGGEGEMIGVFCRMDFFFWVVIFFFLKPSPLPSLHSRFHTKKKREKKLGKVTYLVRIFWVFISLRVVTLQFKKKEEFSR